MKTLSPETARELVEVIGGWVHALELLYPMDEDTLNQMHRDLGQIHTKAKAELEEK